MRNCVLNLRPIRENHRTVIRLLICGLTIISLSSGIGNVASAQVTDDRTGKAPRQIQPAGSSPLLNGVGHFFAYSSEPEPLFKFFRDTLGLPQVWDFRSFGDFASGGVWMGNVEFEVVTWKPPLGDKPPTEFKGIAFEPAGYTDSLIGELDRRAIKHGKPEPTLMKDKQGREFVGWINTGLDGPDGIPPSNVSIFVYDSTSKDKKAARNERSITELQKTQGGRWALSPLKS